MPYVPRFVKTSEEPFPSTKQAISPDVIALAKSILPNEERDLPRPVETRSLDLSTISPAVVTDGHAATIQVIAAEGGPASPGASANFRFSLVNEESYAASCKLTVSDFLSDSGARLPASGAESNPGMPTLNPNSRQDLSLSVRIPERTEHGTYHALMVVSPVISEPVVLVLVVGESRG
ncbi:MAG: hypothetical protein ACJ746_16045 [Bryobacteraceae bacterium]